MTDILLEFAHSQGSEELFHASTHLYRPHLGLVIISRDGGNLTVSLTCLGDVLLSHHELTHSLSDLERSIACYEQAPKYRDSDRISVVGLDTEVGLAYVLFQRFLALGCDEDCRAAVKLLETNLTSGGDQNPCGRAWALTVMGLVKSSVSTTAIMTVSSNELDSLLIRLQRVSGRNMPPQSRYLLSLVVESSLYWPPTVQVKREEDISGGLKVTFHTWNLCSSHHGSMNFRVLRQLFAGHWTSRLHWNDYQAHLSKAIEIAARMEEISRLHLSLVH